MKMIYPLIKEIKCRIPTMLETFIATHLLLTPHCIIVFVILRLSQELGALVEQKHGKPHESKIWIFVSISGITEDHFEK